MDIQALSAGGILDHSLWLIKDRWKFFLATIVLILMPFLVIAQLLVFFFYPDLASMEFDPADTADFDLVAFILGMIVQFAYLAVFWLIVAPFIVGVLMYGMAMAYLDRPVTLRSAFRYTLRRTLRILGVNFIAVIGVVLAAIPTACVLYAGAVFLLLIWWLVMPIIVLENTTVLNAFARSFRLMRGHKVRVFLLIIVTWFMSSWGSFVAMVFPGNTLAIALSQAISAIHIGILSVIIVVTYFSARCQVENLDLDLLVEAVDPPQTQAAVL